MEQLSVVHIRCVTGVQTRLAVEGCCNPIPGKANVTIKTSRCRREKAAACLRSSHQLGDEDDGKRVFPGWRLTCIDG